MKNKTLSAFDSTYLDGYGHVVHKLGDIDAVVQIVMDEALHYPETELLAGVVIQVVYETPNCDRPRFLQIDTGGNTLRELVDAGQSIGEALRSLIPLKQLRAAEAQRKYRKKLDGEQAERDRENRARIQREYRQRKAQQGLKERTLMLDDEMYQRVLQFVASFDENGKLKKGEPK